MVRFAALRLVVVERTLWCVVVGFVTGDEATIVVESVLCVHAPCVCGHLLDGSIHVKRLNLVGRDSLSARTEIRMLRNLRSGRNTNI